MFSRVMLFTISAFIIGAVLAGFVFSQGAGTVFSTTPPASGVYHTAGEVVCNGCVAGTSLATDAVTTTKVLDSTIGSADVNSAEVCTQASGCRHSVNDCTFLLNTDVGGATDFSLAIPVQCSATNTVPNPLQTTGGLNIGSCNIVVMVIPTGQFPDPVDIFTVNYAQGIYTPNIRWTATRSHTSVSQTNPQTPSTVRYYHSFPATGVAGNVILNPDTNLYWWDSHGSIETAADHWSIRDTSTGSGSRSMVFYAC